MMQRLNIVGWIVNAYDYDGRTALHIAASEGHLRAVKYLITHGANFCQKDLRKNMPIDDAKRENRMDVYQYLLDI